MSQFDVADVTIHARLGELSAMRAMLAGKVLRRSRYDFDGDHAGASAYSEKSEAIFLRVDGTFRHETRQFSRVAAPGPSKPRERRGEARGAWSIEFVRDRPALVLRRGGDVIAWWHAEDGGAGVQMLDGEPWKRFAMR